MPAEVIVWPCPHPRLARPQEVSLSSGWGQAYLELADRFDQAIAWVK